MYKNLSKTVLGFVLLFSMQSYGQQFLSKALHTQVDHVQPMTGIVFWSDNTGDLNTLGDKTQLEFAYLIYSDVIEQEGVYDWSTVDNLLTKAANRGRQVILRFRYTYPGETGRSVPLYITEENDYTAQVVKVEGSNTYIPDWSNQTLQDFTLEFYTKFAERYDNDKRLAFLQLGFGSYSEYHLYDGPFTLGQTFPSKAFQTSFLNHVNTQFVNTQWSISIDAAESDYTPISATTSLKDLNYGLFDDSFLHESHSENNNEYNRSSWLFFGATRANNSVAGGELNYYSEWDQEHVLDIAGPYNFTYEELSEMYDITYMIGNDQLNHQSAARIQEAGMANGYHFEVTAFSTDGNTTKVTIKNSGIAPIYYDAYPTIDGVRSTTTLKGLIAGESRTFTINAAASGEDLTIECDRLVSGQEIQFDADIEEEIITSLSNNSELAVYPNPTTGIVHFSQVENISVFNALGENVISAKTDQIDLSNYSNGVYSIIIEGKAIRLIKE